MPLKIAEHGKKAGAREISLSTIIQMVQNLINITYKKIGPAVPMKLTHDMDAHAVHYSRMEIDMLFRDNGYDTAPDKDAYGLRIYLGLHQPTEPESSEMPDRPIAYLNQHTVILVVTHNGSDLVGEGTNSVSVFMRTGKPGLEEGHLCPPPTCGSAIDNGLHP